MNLKKSLVAQIVAAALTPATFAVSGTGIDNNMFSTNIISQSQQKQLATSSTISGMTNHYDAQMGKVTFQWASPNHSKPILASLAKKQQVSYAAEHYLNQLTNTSTNKVAVIKPVLSSIHDQGRGAYIAKYKQEVGGIEVFNREYNIMMDRELNLIASSGYFAQVGSESSLLGQTSASHFTQPSKAIAHAFKNISAKHSNVKLTARESIGEYSLFDVKNSADGIQLLGVPRAKRVYFELKGQLVPAHYVEIMTSPLGSVDSQYNSYVIASKTGDVLFAKNLISHAEEFNYRVYANQTTKKPWDSPHGNVIPKANPNSPDATAYLDMPSISLSSASISTNDPWLADDATQTQGNNVVAYVDAIAPSGLSNGDFLASSTGPKSFDYEYDIDQRENSAHNRKAAIVNLFYVNNYLHDDFYDHGFDEAAGNAQTTNYQRGGLEGDPIFAEVQDNSGFNNANMGTPADGFSPIMQMYLFDSKDAQNGVEYGITVTSHDELGSLETLQRSSFGSNQFDIQSDVIRIDDGIDVTTDGCEAAINSAALAGKIAIIDRGACLFIDKVKIAQEAGATAVIIVNNIDDGTPPSMYGWDDSINIPNMGVNYQTGMAIYEKMAANETVSISMFNKKPYKGSSWDNAIVAHEWGHYISNRLVGNASGLYNAQGMTMGEGWGDFHALLLMSDADDALIAGNEKFQTNYTMSSYVSNFTTGLRSVPYSTDMDKNPLTFGHMANSALPHASGEIWASMLWDSYVGLINDQHHSFTQAQKLMKDYLVASYKMTPIAPTFTEARDALLAAAYANNVADYKIILAAFARRGFGLGAKSPARLAAWSYDVIESYETELTTLTVSGHDLNTNYEGATTGYCSNDNILDKGETGTVSFSIVNRGDTSLENITGKIEVVSDHNVTFANEGIVEFGSLALFESATSLPIEMKLDNTGVAESLVLKLTFPTLAQDMPTHVYSLSTTVNMDFKERPPVNATSTEKMETHSFFNDWQENIIFGGEAAIGTQRAEVGDLVTAFKYGGVDLGDQIMYLGDHNFQSDVAVQSKAFKVGYGGDFTMSFWHFYGLEEHYDGAVIEISINGDEWVDVTSVGGVFDVGYDGELISSDVQSLSGRPVFTGQNIPWSWGNNERINFGTSLNGNEVRLRFRKATDTFVSSFGWWIDNVKFTNIVSPVFSDVVAGDTFACDNRLPVVKAIAAQEVNEKVNVLIAVDASDPNGDALTYVWSQSSGTTVQMTGIDTATASFIAPELVSGSQTLTFDVTVSDGVSSVVNQVAIKVNDVPAPIEPVKKTSSAGAGGLIVLLLSPLALLRRRKYP